LTKTANRSIHKYESTFLRTVFFTFIVLLRHALASSPRVWFNLYRFALKSGRLSSTKARGSLLLYSESIRSSSRKHGDYPGVARQFCVPTAFCYSLRSILLFANTDVFTTKMCLNTSILAKSNMDWREYIFSRWASTTTQDISAGGP
jgi:hypothetical protein